MKRLQEYIKKHGKHFTEDLALKVSGGKFSADQVAKAAQKRVYYNVTDSTLGDMIYLVNSCTLTKKDKCVRYALSIVGDFFSTEKPFSNWICLLCLKEEDFDFTPYI